MLCGIQPVGRGRFAQEILIEGLTVTGRRVGVWNRTARISGRRGFMDRAAEAKRTSSVVSVYRDAFLGDNQRAIPEATRRTSLICPRQASPSPRTIRATSLGQIDESVRLRRSARMAAEILSSKACGSRTSHQGWPRSPSAIFASFTRTRASCSRDRLLPTSAL